MMRKEGWRGKEFKVRRKTKRNKMTEKKGGKGRRIKEKGKVQEERRC